MDAQEQIDLDAMKARVQTIQLETFMVMRKFLRMDATTLKHCGHHSVSAALEHLMRGAVKRCEKETKAFIAKYPD